MSLDRALPLLRQAQELMEAAFDLLPDGSARLDLREALEEIGNAIAEAEHAMSSPAIYPVRDEG
jgi:hypothetical protein